AGTATIVLTNEPERWVGRASYKLAGALDAWTPEGLAVAGRRCLDIGASTGGFTHVLLERGAAAVLALDVGQGQLASTLRDDPRVTELSGTNIRDVLPGSLGPSFGLVVADLSFISLEHVLPRIAEQLSPDGDAVVLVKPQFEVGRDRLGKGGVVRSAGDRARALRAVIGYAEAAQLGVRAIMASPIDGSAGNREYLLWVRPSLSGTLSRQELNDRVDEAVRSRP
ncbi:MAG TPA: TlyA family RNA methyltransferase, partial [Candidatus Lustribacter sp.]|nr:TlyA family RNA methyltransferase [Candidatus Lustribacter sp.]